MPIHIFSPGPGTGMYLSGSKWNMRKKRRRSRPWRILWLLILIAGVIYIWQFYVPATQPFFIPTPTPTRSPASFMLEAESLFEAGKLDQAEQAYLQAIRANPREPAHYVELARVRMFKADEDGSLILLGEDRIKHTPRDEKVSLIIGSIETAVTNIKKDKIII